jgi:hypothetical protein
MVKSKRDKKSGHFAPVRKGRLPCSARRSRPHTRALSPPRRS